MKLAAGTIFANDFEILGVLGEGSTGRVYDARRINEGDEVALKVLQPQFLGDEQIRGRFRREAKVLSRITGPYVCPLLAWGETIPTDDRDPPALWMAMTKIDGLALDQLIDREGQLAMTRACDIAIDVLKGLETVHAAGIIHRDLKPANIMLAERAIVVDFGLAKIVTGEDHQGTALTKGNMLFGTPEYMSPEQARGDDLDATCDVYAMGIILYQMLTAHTPFEGESSLALLTAHMVAAPPPVRSRRADIPEALADLVHRAIEKDRTRRFPTASAFRMSLEEVKQLLPNEDLEPETARSGDSVPSGDRTSEKGRTQPSLPSMAPEGSTTAAEIPEARRKAEAAEARAKAPIRAPSPKKPPRAISWIVVIALAAALGSGAAYFEKRVYLPRALGK